MENNNQTQEEKKEPIIEETTKDEAQTSQNNQGPVRKPFKKRRITYANRQKDLIMKDPEKRKKSVKIGVIGIIVCLLSVALVYPLMWGSIQIVIHGFTHFYAVIGNVFIVGFGLALPGTYIALQIYQFTFPIAQLAIRRDWFGWLCLIIAIIAILAVIVLTLVSFVSVLNIVLP